jgi:hypothetical protein
MNRISSITASNINRGSEDLRIIFFCICRSLSVSSKKTSQATESSLLSKFLFTVYKCKHFQCKYPHTLSKSKSKPFLRSALLIATLSSSSGVLTNTVFIYRMNAI